MSLGKGLAILCAGYPDMAGSGNTLAVGWTDFGDLKTKKRNFFTNSE